MILVNRDEISKVYDMMNLMNEYFDETNHIPPQNVFYSTCVTFLDENDTLDLEGFFNKIIMQINVLYDMVYNFSETNNDSKESEMDRIINKYSKEEILPIASELFVIFEYLLPSEYGILHKMMHRSDCERLKGWLDTTIKVNYDYDPKRDLAKCIHKLVSQLRYLSMHTNGYVKNDYYKSVSFNYIECLRVVLKYIGMGSKEFFNMVRAICALYTKKLQL
jgi:hypothetical protein